MMHCHVLSVFTRKEKNMRTIRIAIPKIEDTDDFFSKVDKCQNQVILHTVDNDFRINLKSTLSKYISIPALTSENQLYIEAESEEDAELIESCI